MKTSEILRNLADMMDAKQPTAPQQTTQQPANPAVQAPAKTAPAGKSTRTTNVPVLANKPVSALQLGVPEKSGAGVVSSEIMPTPTLSVEPGQGDGSGLAQQPDDIFVPPLQLKLELLKKATGVENIYDDPSNQEDGSDDELAAIKKNAGISTVALSAMSDDEPLDD